MSKARLRLADGITFTINATVASVVRSVERHIELGTMLEFENDDGVVRYVNPLQVLYVEPLEAA